MRRALRFGVLCALTGCDRGGDGGAAKAEAVKAEVATAEATKVDESPPPKVPVASTNVAASAAAPDPEPQPATVVVPEPVAPDTLTLFDAWTPTSTIDAAALAAAYPKLRIEAEDKARSFAARRGKHLVWLLSLDADGVIDHWALHAKGPTVAGTSVGVGASFAEVEAALSLDACSTEWGEDPWLMCMADDVTLTWVLGTLEGVDDGPKTIDEARALAGKRGIDTIARFAPSPPSRE